MKLAVIFLLLSCHVIWAEECNPKICGAETVSSPSRSRATVLKFLKLLGRTTTPPGAQVDHILPLHCGGKDEVANLQLTWGFYKDNKEAAERNCETIREWIVQHPCSSGECVKPAGN